ncbi:MAG: ParB/RepB/Spo0J family partition protein [Prevotellaceae bacterium]|jgi:ParB family chromosome partitioning protein|nr:ParB/RepB/Spo0J family partition protein [Prevotellaceae bacterium]
MAKETKRLGRGLDALLGVQPETVAKGASVYVQSAMPGDEPATTTVKSELIKEIPLAQIEPNPSQPRTKFDDEALAELAESIKRLGIIQPLTVRAIGPNRYQIISGERRYRASHLAELEEIPAYIRTADDQGVLEMALVENIQREDLDALEIALSYQLLVSEYGLTQESISNRVGKKRSTVANYLRLLKLPEEIQLAIREDLISMGHARAIINVSDPKMQLSIAKKIVQQGLSVRATEELVKKLSQPKEEKPHAAEPSEELSESFVKLTEGFEKVFSGSVSIKRGLNGGAKLTIDLKTDEDIDKAIAKLTQLA